ncbi:MAG: tRNA (adenosine(37)-N6)-threonylcarbamoyltransferase complex ATPase subunit type 1 TsaE [Comamonas sp.]|nr:tRNA (adenosine(37)-N6)-threonylcarbamoyltransferase complex ATPase subunit type 1 TsaE [Comamonas sp.]
MPALPALAAAPRQFFFEHRSGIGKRTVAERSDDPGDALAQLVQARAHHLVIVAPPGVERDHALARAGQAGPLARGPIIGGVTRQVGHARGDHAERAGQQLGRPGAFEAVLLHVVQTAVVALGQPVEKPRLGRRQVHARDADLGESQLPRPVADLFQQLITVHHHAIVEMPDLPAAERPLELHWHCEADTECFARRLARAPQLAHAFIALHGDLGAGKTTLVRHLLHALGVTGRIKSPTYAVVEPYQVGNLAIWHFDFYRFSDPREWEDAGLRDIFASPGLKLAEWPQNAQKCLPDADLEIEIQVDDDENRRVTLRAGSPLGSALLSALTHPCPKT